MTRSRTRSTGPRFASAWAGALLALGLAAGPAAAAFPGDNGRVSFTSTGDLFTVDAGGDGAPQQLTSTPEPEAQSAFAPDGARIAYRRRATTSTTDPLQVWVMAADGSAQHRVSGSDVQDTQPGWSPDGQQLVFRRTPRGGGNPAGDVWIMRADGTDVRPVILSATADERYPVLSPDGTRIAFTSNRDGNDYEIYVAGADGSNPRALTDHPGYDSAPSWSPDGQQIAFERGAVLDDDPSKDIWVMAADGTGQHQLTATAGVDEGPAWAPAGDAIAFTSGRQGTPDIFRMGVDGSNPQPVVTLEGLQESPDWQALPRATGPGPGPGPTPGAGPVTSPRRRHTPGRRALPPLTRPRQRRPGGASTATATTTGSPTRPSGTWARARSAATQTATG